MHDIRITFSEGYWRYFPKDEVLMSIPEKTDITQYLH